MSLVSREEAGCKAVGEGEVGGLWRQKEEEADSWRKLEQVEEGPCLLRVGVQEVGWGGEDQLVASMGEGEGEAGYPLLMVEAEVVDVILWAKK